MGYIKPPSKTSRWGCLSALAAGGRPARSTANGQIFDRWKPEVDRRVDRPNPESNALWLVDRPHLTVDRSVDRPHPRVGYLQSVDRSVDRPKWLSSVHVLCTSVDRSGRPTLGPVDRSTARAWQAILRDRKLRYNIF